ncbi:MAG: tyrosine-type recombinase/integrase [Bryobacterales bacterium]|nr:tyrosine-type recombinase/integrase [Bryobacterales bacterium]
MTVGEACRAYLRDLKARNLSKGTRRNYRTLFRQLRAYADLGDAERLEDLDRAAMRRWRESWDCAFSTQSLRLKLLKAFFTYACREGWIRESPVEGMRAPKNTSPPTVPLEPREVRALLKASQGKPREQALILLLRYSGLGIGDAATLSRDAIQDNGDLVLRRAKTGELVTVALPAEVTAALDAVRRPGWDHYFWTGRSEPVTVAKYWRERLKQVAADAGVAGFHPHRLRDTFAVSLLLKGVLMQDVSTLLGHGSTSTTERHYAPWCRARRERLGHIVRKVHREDPILAEFTPKKPAGAAATAPAEAGLEPSVKPTRRVQGST